MTKTYKAMQIKSPGELELVEKQVPTPSSEQVLIKVEACGMCGADIADIEKPSNINRVPGHEVIGKIVAIGDPKQSKWKIGQRVGVGRLAGHCYHCQFCRQGKFQHCVNQDVVGATIDGGYAEMMLAPLSGLVQVPSELNMYEAAPILCAGLSVFNALKKIGLSNTI
ncbi:alcohol dehydrogenase catalytic domain-containing protein [Vibrio sp.]|uniref:alcohol dehydrogenase catalytic domain-containing protein n=1 Tax=Vibrio sp. TaxID=678 RepID=UPI00311FA504